MKQLMILMAFVVFTSAQAQDGIALNFNSVGAGKNLSVSYQKDFTDKLNAGLGIKYHLNQAPQFNGGQTYKNNMRAEGLQHLGLVANISYSIKPKSWKLNPMIQHRVEFARAGAKYLLPTNEDNGNLPYFRTITKAPYYTLEETIGVKLESPIVGNYYLNVAGGGGIAMMWGFRYRDERIFEFTHYLSIGLAYKFGKEF